MVAVECVDIKSDAVVVEMCAAPGGKSIHALNSLGPSGTLISNDVDSRRVRVLKENLDRMMNPIALEQRPHYEITNMNAQDIRAAYAGQADLVILDAPCSGEAIMRKSDIARRQWSTKLLAKMMALQKELFDSARALVKPGGMILYSTCTFNSCENDEVIAYAREELNLTPARGQELVKHLEDKTAVSLEGIIERDHGIVLYPHYIRGDGQSVAVLNA
jgi:16S rRNA C967 or C1407 C5-methylase (RsmB/RsmF family)